jgi:hypothetical protein
MKQLLFLIGIFIATTATSQNTLTKDKVEIKQSLKIGAINKVTGVSDDTDTSLKRYDKLITERAAKEFAINAAKPKPIGFRIGFIVDTVNNIVDIDTASLPGGSGASMDSTKFLTLFRDDTSRANLYNLLNYLYGSKKDKGDSINPTGYNTNFKADTSRNQLYDAITRGLINTPTDTMQFLISGSPVFTIDNNNANIVMGTNALYQALHDSTFHNIAIGQMSMQSATDAQYNTVVGELGLGDLKYGGSNVAMGYQAGITGVEPIQTAIAHTVIGSGASSLYNGLSYITALGWDAKVGRSNATVFGDSTYNLYNGFGTSFPTAKLHVHGSFRLVNGSQGAGKVLQSDANGNATWVTPSGGGGSGTVTSVTSADANATIANTTTTPVITIVSAPKLQAARNINGTAFDGTSNITITAAAGTLTGTTLSSSITASSLTSFGSAIALGTPGSGTLTNCTGLPISTGISGLGTGAATWLATPSSANLASLVTDETGTGALVLANAPTLTGTTNVTSLVASGSIVSSGTMRSSTIYGSLSASGSLNLVATSGVGTTASVNLKVGNNGSVTGLTVVNSGAIGIGTTTPDASAITDFTSTTGGVLLPRMTTTQRDAISSPADGLVIYNTSLNKFQGRAAGAWVDFH